MLYHLLVPLSTYFTPFNVFRYITFRAAGAAMTALLVAFIVGPWFIRWLRRGAVVQVVREGTPDTHQDKSNTPTMGGVIILAAGIIPTLLWADLQDQYVWLALLATAWMGGIGFLDDYLKLRQKREGKRNEGLVERYKLIGQLTLGIALGFYLWKHPLSVLPGASSTLPFFKNVIIVPIASLAFLYVGFVAFVLTGTSNAVNLTDGLDGLATGLSAIAFAAFALFAYVQGRVDASAYMQLFYFRGAGELAVFCLAFFGATVGFLWYNCYPAQVFMGDTGSLALGGALGAMGILLKSEFLLLIIGGVFVLETMSVILQRYTFKYRKARFGVDYAKANRLFLRAPIHHHFELKGWSEQQVVTRFWIVGILFAFLALATLKVR
ncbi:MAG TPA: phospho-N-acetylmuramoyl-pentapeptide-transferase [Gemmatimonadaceae bacterium]|nr:phospho-N-acetylmuramoyl-pentapeptide-transferase [Gemmatimonadaceae bacterium]